MDSGKFWQGLLPAGTDTDTGAVPTGRVRSANIVIVNTGDQPASVLIAIASSVSTARQHRIEPELTLAAKAGLYKLTGEPVGAGERIVIRASTADVVARVSGFEEDV